MKTYTLPAYRVFLSDGSDYVTSMSEGITIEDARKYFVGQWFTQSDEKTKLQAVRVELASDHWVIENQKQYDHLGDYCTLGTSIRYNGGSFEIRQRIADTPKGYDEGQKLARLVAASPAMLQTLRYVEQCLDAVSLLQISARFQFCADSVRVAINKAENDASHLNKVDIDTATPLIQK